MKYKIFFITFLELCSIWSNAQGLTTRSFGTESQIVDKDYPLVFNPSKKDSSERKSNKFFIAYDFGEAAFNKFQSLGSEIGVQFKNNHILRLSYTNLKLSEEHLSSGFATAVDGENVRGKQLGVELFYDIPIIVKGLYIAPSVGYYKNEYTHTILNEKLVKSSFTAGASVSFTEADIFKIKGLYYRVSIPVRLNINPIKESKLGETTIRSNLFDNNIWFFVGFQF